MKPPKLRKRVLRTLRAGLRARPFFINHGLATAGAGTELKMVSLQFQPRLVLERLSNCNLKDYPVGPRSLASAHNLSP